MESGVQGVAMSNIINFPSVMHRGLQEVDVFNERAAELRDEARELVAVFPPEAVANILAYAAARLERTGFQMF